MAATVVATIVVVFSLIQFQSPIILFDMLFKAS